MMVRDSQSTPQPKVIAPRFRLLKIIIPVLLALIAISLMAQWYASNVTFPRYCKNPETTLQAVQILIKDDAVIDNDQRRKYMIAAKILFLHPISNNESKSDYMLRLRQLLLVECQ